MPRAPGRIATGGEPGAAEALADALRAPAVDHDVAESLTHPFHSYPARLHPATARVLVEVVGGAGRSGRGRTIVDPFCGSGTTHADDCTTPGRRLMPHPSGSGVPGMPTHSVCVL